MKQLGIHNILGYIPSANEAEHDEIRIVPPIEAIRAYENPFVNGSTTGEMI